MISSRSGTGRRIWRAPPRRRAPVVRFVRLSRTNLTIAVRGGSAGRRGGGVRRRPAGRGRRRRVRLLRLRRVAAVLRHEAGAADRRRLEALLEALDEPVERLLLVLGLQKLLDRLRRLLLRLLVGRRDLLDLVDVPAELRLDRAADRALLGRRTSRRRAPSPAGPWRCPTAAPPWALDASSIEYCLATFAQLSPSSSAFLAALACASVFVSTIRTSRVSGVAKRCLFLL